MVNMKTETFIINCVEHLIDIYGLSGFQDTVALDRQDKLLVIDDMWTRSRSILNCMTNSNTNLLLNMLL